MNMGIQYGPAHSYPSHPKNEQDRLCWMMLDVNSYLWGCWKIVLTHTWSLLEWGMNIHMSTPSSSCWSQRCLRSTSPLPAPAFWSRPANAASPCTAKWLLFRCLNSKPYLSSHAIYHVSTLNGSKWLQIGIKHTLGSCWSGIAKKEHS
jgi:hypothetical protein